jgi:hypothetical protein
MAYKFLGKPGQSYSTRGANYTADASGVVSVAAPTQQDIVDLLNSGLLSLGIVGALSNFGATTDPTAANDSSQDYGVGSIWFNTSTGVEWRCQSAAAAAAVWVPQISASMLLGRLIGANMNVTTDQAIALNGLTALNKFRVTKVTVKNASVSLTTAQGGLYTAASKGGTAIVASTQAYTGLSTTTLALDLTVVTTPGLTVWDAGTPLFLALSTGQGAAATADVYLYGDVYA